MKSIFCQWVGLTAIKDLIIPEAAGTKEAAIVTAHRKYGFDKIMLFGNLDPQKSDNLKMKTGETRTFYLYTPEKFEEYRTAVAKKCGCEASLSVIDSKKVNDLEEIYKITRDSLEKCTSGKEELFYDANSGTTLMILNWYFLWSRFGGRFVATKLPAHAAKEEGCTIKELNVPFEITAEFAPRKKLERFLSDEFEENRHFKQILGKSEKLTEVKKLAQKVAQYSPNVFILGESGTGKELFAQAYHSTIQENEGKVVPYMAINCGAIPENLIEAELFGVKKGAYTGAVDRDGVFQKANGGVLFLDEIGDLSLSAQVKLLRAIPTTRNNSKDGVYGEIYRVGSHVPEKVNMKIVAATNKDLNKLMKNGEFREDLFYRLATIILTLPPLRQRKDDIDILIKHYLDEWNKEYKIEKRINQKGVELLKRHPWPGNIRELGTTIRRILIYTENKRTISEQDIENALFGGESGEVALKHSDLGNMTNAIEEIEKKYIKQALKESSFKIKEAAKLLNMEERTLRNRIKKLDIKIEKGFY